MTASTVDQLVVEGSLGDLPTSVALRVRAALRRSGPSDVYAVHVHSSAVDDVVGVSHLDNTSRDRVLLYHAGNADAATTQALLATRSKIVLFWHSPSATSSATAEAKAQADWTRYELQLIRPKVVAAVADTEAGAAVLVAAGYSGVHVMSIPSVTGSGEPRRAISSPTGFASRSEFTEHPFVLTIDHAGCDSRSEVVVQAVSLVQRVLGKNVGVVVVVGETTSRYALSLRELTRQSRVRYARFPAVTCHREVDELLHSAAMVVVTGQPMATPFAMQAMAADVPVLVAATDAPVAEAEGKGVLALPTGAGPMMLSETIGLLLTDESVHAMVRARGERFVREALQNDQTPRLLELLEGLAP